MFSQSRATSRSVFFLLSFLSHLYFLFWLSISRFTCSLWNVSPDLYLWWILISSSVGSHFGISGKLCRKPRGFGVLRGFLRFRFWDSLLPSTWTETVTEHSVNIQTTFTSFRHYINDYSHGRTIALSNIHGTWPCIRHFLKIGMETDTDLSLEPSQRHWIVVL